MDQVTDPPCKLQVLDLVSRAGLEICISTILIAACSVPPENVVQPEYKISPVHNTGHSEQSRQTSNHIFQVPSMLLAEHCNSNIRLDCKPEVC